MRKLSLMLLAVFITGIVVAIPVLAAGYSYEITLTESDGNSYTNTPFIATVNNTGLVSQGYLSSTGLDGIVKDGGIALPTMIADDKVLFVDNLNANQSKTVQYTMGNTPLASMPIILGTDGYITTPYNASLVLGEDFNIATSGYVDTTAGVDKYIRDEPDSLTLKVSDTTNGTITLTATNEGGPTSVSVTGIPSGHYVITCTLYLGVLTLDVGGTANATTFGARPANNMTICLWDENNVMPYIDYIEETITGTPTLKYQPTNIISGTVLPDYYLTQDAEITWGTSGGNPVGNPTGTTTTTGGFTPSVPTVYGSGNYAAFGGNDPGTFDLPNPVAPPQLYTELDASKIPGGGVINELLNEGGVPQALWWFPFIFIGVTLIGMLVYDATQRTGGQGSLLAMCLTILIGLVIFGVMGVTGVSGMIPLWTALLFPIPAAALILSRRHVGWG